ncbi:hypothetical protein [Anaerobaca lacustris]|uniref:AsmA-like C-terminal domain-containing protein n=1 Tax=Anaerobaca lacustris TaxID=3044600 RepID=A0AAW6U317_9BACT|nr:hypothetical protein [Sedimentisphaerales bacterium M17dextr]
MRRWAIRIVVGVVVVLLLAGLGVQIVLSSDLPRRWILRAAGEQLGLQVTAESLSIGWTGRTSLRDLSVAAPLSEEQVLRIEAVDLSHHSIPLLVITRSLGLDSVRIDRPQLDLRRDTDGRWNVQDVIDRLVAHADRAPDRRAAVTLPRVDVRDALVRIIEPNEDVQTVGPVAVFGMGNGLSTWGFNLKAAQGTRLHGELAQGGNWAHRIDFHVEPNDLPLAMIRSAAAGPIHVSGRWSGQVQGDRLAGTLRLDRLDAGPASVAGAVDVTLQGGGLVLNPQNLAVTEPNLAGQKLRFTAGSIRLDRDGVRADRLVAATESGASQISGHWDFDRRGGDFTASWAGQFQEPGGEHDGTARLAIRSPRFGRKEVTLNVALTARNPVGELRVGTEIRGAGGDWWKSLWEASVDELTWTSKEREIDLGDASAKVSVDWPKIQLASLRLPDTERTAAAAELNVQTLHWSVQVDAKGVERLDRAGSGLDIRIAGSGDQHEAVISELRLAKGDRAAVVKGKLALPSGEIQEGHLSARWSDRRSGAAEPKPPEVPGRWTCEVDVEGKVRPIDLRFSGTVAGRSVRLGRRKVTEMTVPLQGTVNAEYVQIATEPFDLLGGRWQLSGRHELSSPLTQLGLTIDDLSLQAAAEMAGSPLKYQGQAKARLQLAVPDFAMDKALAYGRWDVEGLHIPPFEAERGQGTLRIADGVARLDEIRLEQGRGQATGSMHFRLDQPQRVSIEFKAVQWPVEWEPQAIRLLVDSNAAVVVDIQKKSFDGQAQLDGRLSLADESFGRLGASVQLQERTLDLREFRGELLGGQVEGAARIPLDGWHKSTGQMKWQGIEPNQLTSWWPPAAQLAGKLSGTLVATEADAASRSLEPLRVELRAEIPGGRFAQAHLGDCHAVAYIGPNRLVVDRMDANLLGGVVKGWARASPHAGGVYLTAVADFNDLDLSQFSKADPTAKAQKIVGKLAGRATVMTSTDWRYLSGQADVDITESDLVNAPIIRTLYDTLSLGLGHTQPEGTGQVKLRFEGTRIRIPSFAYFNRGVEVRGAGQIVDFTRGSDSPIEGYAVGSTRVLKGIRLPGVRELDRLMASMQTGVASVAIDGTLDEIKVSVVPLPVISGALRGLLWSQLRE